MAAVSNGLQNRNRVIDANDNEPSIDVVVRRNQVSEVPAAIAESIRDDVEVGTLSSDRVGSSFLMTCSAWKLEGRYIAWRVNPSDVNWTLRLRQTDQQTRGGIVSHVWRDPLRDSFFDEPVLRFSLQSGNIMPIPTRAQHNEARARTSGIRDVLARETRALREDEVRNADRELQKAQRALWDATDGKLLDWDEEALKSAALPNPFTDPERFAEAKKAISDIQAAKRHAEQAAAKKAEAEEDIEAAALAEYRFDMQPGVPPGLHNFYQFLSLMDQQRVITDPDSDLFGQMNLIEVTYNSNIFPQLTLIGTITPDGTSWTDNSMEPNHVDSWSASMTVYRTIPRLSAPTLIETFQQLGFRRSIV